MHTARADSRVHPPGAAAAPPTETDRGGTVTTAKLHVLQLEPIKLRLGNKWPKLSALVHKLFEKALTRAQGPRDHFIRTDELSYIATFHGQSPEEAGLACAAIAKQVCEQLFGDDVDEVSVRNLIGAVSDAIFAASIDGADISAHLEAHGCETTITHRAVSKVREKPAVAVRNASWISRARVITTPSNICLGYFPVWDILKRKSSALFLKPFIAGANQRTGGIRRLLANTDEHQIVDIETTLLFAAGEYAARVAEAQKVCAVSVGVSFETLSGHKSRGRYLAALKSLQTHASCPVLLKVEQVPDGMPLGRLAELGTLLAVNNVRTLIEFHPARALPEFDIRLGITGIGATLPAGCEPDRAAAMAQLLTRRAAQQKLLVFLDGLANEALLDAATQNQVRMGTGDALDTRHYTGLEPLPSFPLLPTGY